MNSASPFLPPGSEVERQNQARSRLKVKIFAALGVNVAVLLALLLTPGCKREQPQPQDAYQPIFTESNPPDFYASEPATSTYAEPDPASFYTPPTDPVTDPVLVTPQPTFPQPAAVPGAMKEYKIKAGDTYYSIGKDFGVTMKALQDANPNVDPARLQIGKTILVPPPAPATTATTSSPPPPGVPGQVTHKVVSGDTLSGLATKYNTTVKAIQTANGLTDTRIKVGDVLKIPAGSR
jgi:LysM repeat protein